MALELQGTRAEAADADQQLITRAAWEAARLAPLCPDWPLDKLRTLVFSVALVALKGTLSRDAYAALRRRYHAEHAWFIGRLAALGV
jgi:hypothetical protein